MRPRANLFPSVPLRSTPENGFGYLNFSVFRVFPDCTFLDFSIATINSNTKAFMNYNKIIVYRHFLTLMI